jgi:hypothetical protein
MSNRYGQTITWGPLTAPALFTGERQSYSYRDAVTKQNISGAAGDHFAQVLHSRKAALSFTAKVTSGATDFLDISDGAAIAVSGVTGGQVIVSRAVETWRLLQPKTASITASHYPDMPLTNTAAAAATLSAFTPDQSALGIVFPSGLLTFSTFGLTHATGIVHELTIEQILQLTDDEPSPDGKLLGCQGHGYERMIRLLLLATAAAPAVKSVLTIGGAPDHASDYRITDVEQTLEDQRGKMFAINASWIPPFTE